MDGGVGQEDAVAGEAGLGLGTALTATFCGQELGRSRKWWDSSLDDAMTAMSKELDNTSRGDIAIRNTSNFESTGRTA